MPLENVMSCLSDWLTDFAGCLYKIQVRFVAPPAKKCHFWRDTLLFFNTPKEKSQVDLNPNCMTITWLKHGRHTNPLNNIFGEYLKVAHNL